MVRPQRQDAGPAAAQPASQPACASRLGQLVPWNGVPTSPCLLAHSAHARCRQTCVAQEAALRTARRKNLAAQELLRRSAARARRPACGLWRLIVVCRQPVTFMLLTQLSSDAAVTAVGKRQYSSVQLSCDTDSTAVKGSNHSKNRRHAFIWQSLSSRLLLLSARDTAYFCRGCPLGLSNSRDSSHVLLLRLCMRAPAGCRLERLQVKCTHRCEMQSRRHTVEAGSWGTQH